MVGEDATTACASARDAKGRLGISRASIWISIERPPNGSGVIRE